HARNKRLFFPQSFSVCLTAGTSLSRPASAHGFLDCRLHRRSMEPIVFAAEILQHLQIDPVLGPVTGALAGDDIAERGDRKPLIVDTSGFGGFVVGNPVGGMHQVHVERAGLDLNEIATAENGVPELAANAKAEPTQSPNNFPCIGGGFWEEQVNVLSRRGVAQKNRPALTDEQIIRPCSAQG